ncbi:hypothetical protein H2198_009115 [Neophaeococcomyces mojaviensis]|uniref:Uncharacterized protein n=1 Tax=Neophaeococcomyces mojaviensis TaxID=3383035 RepID=A0ACC2ZVH6_9EURO|nr:hypothetical protein H2198_009115 [Knufia sp. JES_112]
MEQSTPPRDAGPPRPALPPPTIHKAPRFAANVDGADDGEHKGLSASKEDESIRKSKSKVKHNKWTLGILADNKTDEVPGTVLLLSKYSTRNIPLGLQHEPTRGRSSTRGSMSGEVDRRRSLSKTKKTPDGKIVLNPQPDDSMNDPLNWPAWRRDAALMSLGFYCMLGGGMTPILAAGFNQVANTLHVSYGQVARTTGLYMMGLGVGSVLFSPTAILFGKRPVYLLGAVLFVVSSVWCALSPNYANLATARVFQGIAVSPVECLPSATIAEIFFLHERAFRVGIYTLLLLGGKNLVPLVSAAIIQGLSWRWAFYVVAIIVGFAGVLLFLFVPETFWDRTPRPKGLSNRSTSRLGRRSASRIQQVTGPGLMHTPSPVVSTPAPDTLSAGPVENSRAEPTSTQTSPKPEVTSFDGANKPRPLHIQLPTAPNPTFASTSFTSDRFPEDDPSLPTLHNLNSPYYLELEKNDGYLDFPAAKIEMPKEQKLEVVARLPPSVDPEKQLSPVRSPVTTDCPSTPTVGPGLVSQESGMNYTAELRQNPPKPWTKTLNPWNGRLTNTSWLRAAIRPFILFAYPAVLWSALVYSLSVGWLIVLSESVSAIYANRSSYNFNSLQIGLVYMSPFIGGILGTVVAGKVSDIVVRFMARRNGGVYEPEYRLIMALPIAICTAIGLMGFGWSAEERDAWIVPTIFFGIISFGCSLGSTTAITFCVDSYRQYAGEALVTLNFSKNILHGLVWSLFFPQWLEADGPKDVFVAIGGIQIACLLFTIPMYILGKRARMWTVRKSMMDRF